MLNPWLVVPATDSTEELATRLEHAHDVRVADRRAVSGVRKLVEESWARSLLRKLDPATAGASLELDDGDLREYRDQHPLSIVLPVIRRLLTQHVTDAGLIVAVGDEGGRLLWIDGDRSLRRRAEEMMFVEGANWSEQRVGTSAPGTAIELNHGIQIQRAEHFNPVVHPWSCTAVPVHDPDSGALLGVIDITGGDEAVAPHTLPLIEAAVAAAEAELRIHRLRAAVRITSPQGKPVPARRTPSLSLHVLGRSHATVESAGRTLGLSPRHAEILTLLAWHQDGLSAEQLTDLLYGSDGSVVTLRVEMVRLRRTIAGFAPLLTPTSRPYRLGTAIDVDAQQVLSFLDRGAHRVALAGYPGAVLPASRAPGILSIRAEVSSRLREALLTDGSAETLLAYARSDDAAYDIEVWRACLTLLPPRSPKRAGVVSRLEHIEAELGRWL